MAKSMIAGLQAELAAKRKTVKRCEETLESVREAAEKYVERRVARAKGALDSARAELDRYVRKVAQALGLPHPAAAREARARLRRVRDLLDEGKSAEQIAKELNAPLALIKVDVGRLRSRDQGESDDDNAGPRGEVTSAPKGKASKKERVRELFEQGLAVGEIAEKMGIGKSSVYGHICLLRKEGRLPKQQAYPPTPAAASQAPARPAPPEAPTPHAPRPPQQPRPIEGDKLEELRIEVARQQGGNRAKAAKLSTTSHEDHEHEALVDRMGDGSTLEDDTGHRHRIYRFVVSVANQHQHGLRVPARSST